MTALIRENYFDPESEMEYFGSTQIRNFMKCEAQALAKIRGEYAPEKSTALLVGSYVDAHFDGSLDLFKAKHPDLFKRNGELKAEYVQAEEIISRMERDDMMVKYVSGEQQVVMTATLFGHPFKIMIDSYHPGRAIVDRKIMKDFAPIYVEGMGRVNFAIAWGYDIQGAIYQAVEYQYQIDHGNPEAKPLPFIIAGATKQKDGADIGLFKIDQSVLDSALKIVEHRVDHFADVKRGLVDPERCENCAYCRQTKILRTVQTLEEVDE